MFTPGALELILGVLSFQEPQDQTLRPCTCENTPWVQLNKLNNPHCPQSLLLVAHPKPSCSCCWGKVWEILPATETLQWFPLKNRARDRCLFFFICFPTKYSCPLHSHTFLLHKPNIPQFELRCCTNNDTLWNATNPSSSESLQEGGLCSLLQQNEIQHVNENKQAVSLGSTQLPNSFGVVGKKRKIKKRGYYL